MYSIGICDDDIAFGGRIEKYLQEFAHRERLEFDIIIFLSGDEYLRFLREEPPLDIIFLDIEFGGSVDGVTVGEVIRSDLNNETTQIVYVSAMESYALRLFKNRPLDFLVKPVTGQDIDRVVKEYIRIYGQRSRNFFEYGIDRKRFRVRDDEIMYFQCVGRKVEIVTGKGRNAEFYGNMDEVAGKLNEDNFWRIHKSYIVNISYISEFRVEEVCLTNGEVLPVSRRRREGIQEKILEERIRRRK